MTNPPSNPLPASAGDIFADALHALAGGDFSGLAAGFSEAGLKVNLPAPGILRVVATGPSVCLPRLLLSVGIHGDETAPIDMLAQVLVDLVHAPYELGVDLLVVVGNPAAIAKEQRYIDADLNRLFRDDRGALQTAQEAQRADTIMQAAAAFFLASDGPRWHLDLHAAIRPSQYPAFAVVPLISGKAGMADQASVDMLIAWLGGAGIDAVILNRKLAATFSAYTAARFGAVACTVELGQIGELGKNDLTLFADTRHALDALLRSGRMQPLRAHPPEIFEVAQEIIKHSDDFRMSFDRGTKNFTAMEAGSVIARDGDIIYRVGDATEFVVFPNPDVGIGQRAGLMIARR